MTCRKILVHDGIGTNGGIVADLDVAKKFGPRPNVAIITNAGGCVSMAGLCSYHNTNLKPTIGTNTSMVINYNGTGMRDGKPWAEDIRWDRKAELAAESAKTEIGPCPE